LHGSFTYEQSLRDYFPVLLTALAGCATTSSTADRARRQPAAIWSIDNVHLD